MGVGFYGLLTAQEIGILVKILMDATQWGRMLMPVGTFLEKMTSPLTLPLTDLP
jgi:hypothetical protein